MFREWLVAVKSRFPEFEELARIAENDNSWPDGYDSDRVLVYFEKSGRHQLIPLVRRALTAFEMLCTPTAPVPDELRG
ncbi:MAG: hypothetical protein DMF44_13645 [Verrucomicrobia bacterium]|nr:MAG: hypothetical protein DMF44_13645 [Verrucomicrobiota bacterium]